MTSAHSTRNTSIRTRKIRGEDSLVSSISIAERVEGPEALLCHPLRGTGLETSIWHSGAGKKLSRPFGAITAEPSVLKPGFGSRVV